MDRIVTYNDFIQNIIDTRGQWNIPEGEYFEMHHIIPSCLGGEGDYFDLKSNKWKFTKNSTNKNCIWLYKKEHIEAHRLLMLENKNNQKLACAYFFMSKDYNTYNENYKLAQARKGAENGMYGVHRFGKDSPTYGKHWKVSEEKRKNFDHHGEKNSMWGKNHSDLAKERMKKAKLDENGEYKYKGENAFLYGLKGDKHPCYGLKWWCNGVDKPIKAKESPGPEYHRGRK